MAKNSNDNRQKLSFVHPSAFQLSQKLKDCLDSSATPMIWHELGVLAARHGSIDLGSGLLEWNPPHFVIQAMKNAILNFEPEELHRNAIPPLAQALAEIYTRRWHWQNQPIDPARHVAISSVGCANMLFCAFQGILNPGDEVIVMEPSCEIYANQIRMAGGKTVYIPLRYRNESNKLDSNESSFTLDVAELEDSITDRTKILLLNTPHNPTGKVFTPTELQTIAAIVTKHPSITIISDEVYEHLIYETKHTSMAIYNPFQTLTISSSAKTFSVNAWKVGWAIGPAHLIHAIQMALQSTQNAPSTSPNQDATATCLIQAEAPYEDPETGNQFDSYYQYLAMHYRRKRTLLYECLQSTKMTPILPLGGVYMLADASNTDFPYENDRQRPQSDVSILDRPSRDWALCRWLTEEVGVTPAPGSVFYHSDNDGASNLIRFSLGKTDDTLAEVQHRLEMYFGFL